MQREVIDYVRLYLVAFKTLYIHFHSLYHVHIKTLTGVIRYEKDNSAQAIFKVRLCKGP